ncbi:hypothetical protein A5819_002255 [Enterococcus sp. 7E2_DIV0204]|uniref:heavy metal translocating P-type ATPase n=1 Tax=Enterococcus sp. 7E2_DIV0204 TaxID=1834188 RepID=UPI000A3321F7|nr:heavy metal translocating P-type ATPase [Enterococcus sp. 7E2_DIV0204]OTN89757.1 hypothetical protein A5819_002255 [Enterococcus sp. 7E2_DIV0204]
MMLSYKIVFSTKHRTRIELPFKLNQDIKEYLEYIIRKNSTIKKVHFYNDNRHIAIYQNKYNQNEIRSLLENIDSKYLKKCYEHPKLVAEATPYNIIAKNFYKRSLIKLLIPTLFRNVYTMYQSIPFAIEMYKSLKQKRLNMDVLDGLAIIVSLLIGDFKSASTITFLLSLGTELENWSKNKSVKDLELALKQSDEKVWILNDNCPIEIGVSNVKKEDLLIIYEGSEILFDGQVIGGEGFVDESSITGESYPVSKKVGTVVNANTLLTNGELIVSVTNDTPNSGIIKVIELINNSELPYSSKQKQLISSADNLVKYNFLGMFLTFVFTRSISKTLSFLMVDFSCSVKLSTPVAYISAVKEALDNGIVIKSSNILDTYNSMDTFIFDKTGTITTSQPKVKEVVTFNDYTESDVIRIGACLEEHVYHPIANALVSEAKNQGIIHEEMHGELYHIASKGIRSSIDNVPVVIGSMKFIKEEKVFISIKQSTIIQKFEKNYNLLYLGYNRLLVAIFVIDTPIRTDAEKTIHFLKKNNKQVVLLTGDTEIRTKAVIKDLFFDEVRSDLQPEDKFNYVQRLKSEGQSVVMVGDGLNDSAAISLADIGISMGESSDISRQVSDITFLSNNLSSLIYMDSLVDRLSNKIKQNLKITFSINGSLIILGLLNILTPTTLSMIHNLTTFSIVGTSFLLSTNQNLNNDI